MTDTTRHPPTRFGTCSWKYDSWRGIVYSDAPKLDYLAEYARRFDCVEVDQWFWSLFGPDQLRLPSRELAAEYAAAVPKSFRFAVKMPNALTLTHYHPKTKTEPLVPNPHFLSPDLLNRTLDAPAPLREPFYDLDGNMLTNGVFSYTYDAENRLTAAYSNSVCVVSNAYDYMSRRVLKISHGGAETRRFVYDGWLPILEIVATASGVTTNAYVWGKDLSGSQQGAGGVGGLLAVRQDNAWYFPFYDANGNIMAYADESGAVMAEYCYDAFGGTVAKSGSMAETFRHRFSTKYYDAETGLYYYGMRFYSPDLHRWLNRDPIEEDGGLNLYGFCWNNGVNGWDALGHAYVRYLKHEKTSLWQKIRGKGSFVEAEIMSAGDIPIEYGSTAGAWGVFSYPLGDVPVIEGSCEIRMWIKIIIADDLPKTGKHGVVYQYFPHGNLNGTLTGGGSGASDGSPPLEGEVIAHEQGHAKAFWEHTRSCFDKAIAEKFPGKLKASDRQEVNRLLGECRRQTQDKNVEYSNNATLNWYKTAGYLTRHPDLTTSGVHEFVLP